MTKKTLRQPRRVMRSSRWLMGSLVLALGCGGGDSGKKPGDSGKTDGGDNGNADGSASSGSSSGEAGMFRADSGSNGATGDASCGASPFGAEPVKVNMLVLLDRSKSMEGDFAGTNRWSATKSSLASALGGVQDELAFGLQIFPAVHEKDQCAIPGASEPLTVPLAAGSTAVPSIVAALDATSPGGGTPTAAALGRALNYFASTTLEGERYVLLVTDGGPGCNGDLTCDTSSCIVHMDGRCDVAMPMECCSSNCCDPNAKGGSPLNCLDDTGTLAQIQALRTANISTFVVGIPGSEAFANTLNTFAVAGGVPNTAGTTSYFAVDQPAALTAVLSSITKSLVKTCRFQLNSVPPALDQLNVKVEGEIIPRGAADGWDLDESTTPPTVVIQGAACERIESMGVESVEVVYGCPTVVVI